MTIDIEKIKKLIPEKRGNITAIARCFKVPRQAIQRIVGRHAELQELVADAREMMLDEAEDSLGKAIRKGERWAVCFALKTQGRARGYVEKTEVESSVKITEYRVIEPGEEGRVSSEQ